MTTRCPSRVDRWRGPIYTGCMADHHGGFYILRDDAELATIALDVVRDFLGDTSQDPLTLLWFGREGVGALLLSVTNGDDRPGAWTCRWVAENLALGSRLARATSAPVWGYTYDNLGGTEAVTRFSADGTSTHDRTTPWEEGSARAIDALTDELEVPRVLVEYDNPFATPGFVQRLDESVDREAFEQWLADRPVVRWPRNADTVVLHLQADAARELEVTADALGVRPGDAIDAMWESAKPEIYAAIPLVEYDHLTGPEAFMTAPASRPTPLVLPEPGDAPPLDGNSVKRPIRLLLSPDTIREMQELALAGDRSQSYVLQKTYKHGRARLLAARTPTE